MKDPLGNTALQGSVTFTPQTNGWYDAYFPGDSNYYQSNSNSTFITVNIPGFSVAANQNSSLPITAGQSATTTITVTPATNSTSPVTLACYLSYIPGSTCSFSPSTLTLSNSNPANATLTISVPPPSGSNMVASVPRMLPSFCLLRTAGESPSSSPRGSLFCCLKRFLAGLSCVEFAARLRRPVCSARLRLAVEGVVGQEAQTAAKWLRRYLWLLLQ